MDIVPAPATVVDHRDEVALPARLHPEDAETVLLVVEGHALNQPGEVLDRGRATVVGHAAMISAGEWVQAAGIWANDRTHDLQFQANFLRATAPTTIDGIEK